MPLSTDATEMHVSLKYQGPFFEAGRMDARMLGLALHGLGEAVAATSREIYNDDARIRLDVQADFEHASFGMKLIASSHADLLPALDPDQIRLILEMLGLVGGGGIVAIYRWLRGRSIERIETRGDGPALIHAEGGASVEINVQELHVFLNPAVRRGLQDFVAPLEEKGAESISVSVGDESPTTILREEIEYFAPRIPGETVSTNVSEARLEIISPQFREGNKWRFQHGSVTFF